MAAFRIRRSECQRALFTFRSAFEREADFLELRPIWERRSLGAEQELIALPSRVEAFEHKTIAAVFIELTADANPEARAAIHVFHLQPSERDRHRESTFLGNLMCQRMHTAACTSIQALRTTFTHAPVFHRVRPKLATEKHPIMCFSPIRRYRFSGSNRRLPARDACECSSSDEFKTSATSDFRCHARWERTESSAFSAN